MSAPPPRNPTLFGEQEEAQRALHGLEGLLPVSRPRRTFQGPREPEALLAHYGLAGFRPGQRDAVAAALAGRDALVVMPTGGGKSLCYQLPGLAGEELTIVVSPLIALMADQVKRLAAGGHPAVMLASGLAQEQSRAALEAVSNGRARIVYCSPERFGSVAFLEAIGRRPVDLFAIDEAHCVSEWGHDFRPDYLRLPRAVERLGRPAIMACTATATPQVATEIEQRLGLRDPLRVSSGFDRPNLSFDTVTFEGKGARARKLALLAHGLADPGNRTAIVYCGTRRDTEEVGEALRGRGLAAVAYHAGMEPDERASAQHRFMSGDADVVVATNAFGMGVDKAEVRSVWHWAIPTSVEAYYQEAGRAGRDGLPARAVLLAMRSDLGRLVRFIELRSVDPAAVEARLAAMRREAGAAGELTIESPRRDEDRIALAVAERAGACSVEPAPGGRLVVDLTGEPSTAKIGAACRLARDRSWRAYRAVEAFSFSRTCRRRSLLDHFGDSSPGQPTGRCCDVCESASWLPDPATIPALGGRRRAKRTPAPAAELTTADAELLEVLRSWRLRAAAGKPAYTVANNATLAAIAGSRPADTAALEAIKGIGPAFIRRHADDVLALVAEAA
ncbi:MAG TPA: ATP-dependent DNA helicase RecQ [Solirubrobacterales bacterium]|jgi:ATP-dependent DNA helicase RecQ|nr:ATP-dependent DNA helicase RecQ [Solirubrobacterales bacterium]